MHAPVWHPMLAVVTGYSIFEHTIVDMTWTELEAAAANGALTLLPIGVVEEHGPHLPLGVDIYGSVVLARLVRRALHARDVPSVIAPPFYWGVNRVTSAFPGSFRVRPEVAAELLCDVTSSLRGDGFEQVYLVNHHGDLAHTQMLLSVLERHHDTGWDGIRWPAPAKVVERLEQRGNEPWWVAWQPVPDQEPPARSAVLGLHAHENETAMMIRWFPELVRYQALETLSPTDLNLADLAEWRRGGEAARAVTPLGYFGSPQPLDARLWRTYLSDAEGIAEAIAKTSASGG